MTRWLAPAQPTHLLVAAERVLRRRAVALLLFALLALRRALLHPSHRLARHRHVLRVGVPPPRRVRQRQKKTTASRRVRGRKCAGQRYDPLVRDIWSPHNRLFGCTRTSSRCKASL